MQISEYSFLYSSWEGLRQTKILTATVSITSLNMSWLIINVLNTVTEGNWEENAECRHLCCLLIFSFSSYGSGTLEMILSQLFSKSREHSRSAPKTSALTSSTCSSSCVSTTPAVTGSVTGTGTAAVAAWVLGGACTEGPLQLRFLKWQWEVH